MARVVDAKGVPVADADPTVGMFGGGIGSGRGGRGNVSKNTAYKNFMADRNAHAQRNRGKTSTINFPFGGLGGGKNVGYAWDDYDRQMALMDKIGEMSAGYSTYGTLGDTVVD